MKTFFKPVSLLFYFFTVVDLFIAGMFYAGLSGAGKNQGLASGAIVLGYGAIFGLIALIAALYTVARAKRATIVLINKILGIVFLLFLIFIWYRIAV